MSESKFLPAKVKQVGFAAVKEPWCEYELEDGSILKVRIMLASLLDEGKFDPTTALPVYQMQMQQNVHVDFSDAAQAAAAERKGKRHED